MSASDNHMLYGRGRYDGPNLSGVPAGCTDDDDCDGPCCNDEVTEDDGAEVDGE